MEILNKYMTLIFIRRT